MIATSDLHGNLPDIEPCDLLVVAGDVCPLTDHDPKFQSAWLDSTFRPWLEAVPAREIVGIADNHDFVFLYPELVPDLPWRYLQDSSTTVLGLNIYGTPWTKTLGGWAFEGDEVLALEVVFSQVPNDLDVLVSHSPPHGFGDRVVGWFGQPGERVGSKALRRAIERARPQLALFGHIHEATGNSNLASLACPTSACSMSATGSLTRRSRS